MVIHTQTIRRLLLTNCLSVFDHFVGLLLKGLMFRHSWSMLCISCSKKDLIKLNLHDMRQWLLSYSHFHDKLVNFHLQLLSWKGNILVHLMTVYFIFMRRLYCTSNNKRIWTNQSLSIPPEIIKKPKFFWWLQGGKG